MQKINKLLVGLLVIILLIPSSFALTKSLSWTMSQMYNNGYCDPGSNRCFTQRNDWGVGRSDCSSGRHCGFDFNLWANPTMSFTPRKLGTDQTCNNLFTGETCQVTLGRSGDWGGGGGPMDTPPICWVEDARYSNKGMWSSALGGYGVPDSCMIATGAPGLSKYQGGCRDTFNVYLGIACDTRPSITVSPSTGVSITQPGDYFLITPTIPGIEYTVSYDVDFRCQLDAATDDKGHRANSDSSGGWPNGLRRAGSPSAGSFKIQLIDPNAPPNQPDITITPDQAFNSQSLVATLSYGLYHLSAETELALEVRNPITGLAAGTIPADPDGDAVFYKYQWYQQRPGQTSATRRYQTDFISDTTNTLLDNYTESGDIWTCKVIPRDAKLLEGPYNEAEALVLREVNGRCDPNTNESYFYSNNHPEYNLCINGTAGAVGPSINPTFFWEWECLGGNEGRTVDCYAYERIDAECGLANGSGENISTTSLALCNSGNSANVDYSAWTWDCENVTPYGVGASCASNRIGTEGNVYCVVDPTNVDSVIAYITSEDNCTPGPWFGVYQEFSCTFPGIGNFNVCCGINESESWQVGNDVCQPATVCECNGTQTKFEGPIYYECDGCNWQQVNENCTSIDDEDQNGDCNYDNADCSHGDITCPVDITYFNVLDLTPCPGDSLIIECNASASNINSLYLEVNYAGSGALYYRSNAPFWDGYKATFIIIAPSTLGDYDITCKINTSRSYSNNAASNPATIQVGGPTCCSGYADESTCESQSCKWCLSCRSDSLSDVAGRFYTGDSTDRCVTNTALSCTKTCDAENCILSPTQCHFGDTNCNQLTCSCGGASTFDPFTGLCIPIYIRTTGFTEVIGGRYYSPYGNLMDNATEISYTYAVANSISDDILIENLGTKKVNNTIYPPYLTSNINSLNPCNDSGVSAVDSLCLYDAGVNTGKVYCNIDIPVMTILSNITYNYIGCVKISDIWYKSEIEEFILTPPVRCPNGTRLCENNTCRPDCGTYGNETFCGNNKIDINETCDGSNIPITCQNLRFDTGNLMCTSGCLIDSSLCYNYTNTTVIGEPDCGNNRIDTGETCDPGVPMTLNCTHFGFDNNVPLTCSNCQLNTSHCTMDTIDPFCGDGNINTGENCDGDNLAGLRCADFGFTGGALDCTLSCWFDTSGCTGTIGTCPNGVINIGEDCDGSVPSAITCESLGFDSGVLSCLGSCIIDTSGCIHDNDPPDQPTTCNNNGNCDFGELCTCSDCVTEPECSTYGDCDTDGVCEFGETCSCSDCSSELLCSTIPPVNCDTDDICEPSAGETCTCSDCELEPLCLDECNGDGTCDPGETCGCGDCTSESFCTTGSGCTPNGVCEQGETCACSDCYYEISCSIFYGCDNDGVCDVGENCECSDCENERDGCDSGHMCQNEVCVPVVTSLCPEGTRLCEDNVCRENCGGSEQDCIEDGVCDGLESCACSDCSGQPDHCEPGLYCDYSSGTCEPPKPPCPTGTRLCSDNECREDCGGSETGCNYDSVCDFDESCSCSDCLHQGDTCASGLQCCSNQLCKSTCVEDEGCAEGILCPDGICRDTCNSYETECDYNNICDINESCYCSDCDGKQDFCQVGNWCENNLCISDEKYCGNNILDQGEICDDGDWDNTDNCTTECKFAYCGDGYIWLGYEDCDDGMFNGVEGFCSAACYDLSSLSGLNKRVVVNYTTYSKTTEGNYRKQVKYHLVNYQLVRGSVRDVDNPLEAANSEDYVKYLAPSSNCLESLKEGESCIQYWYVNISTTPDRELYDFEEDVMVSNADPNAPVNPLVFFANYTMNDNGQIVKAYSPMFYLRIIPQMDAPSGEGVIRGLSPNEGDNWEIDVNGFLFTPANRYDITYKGLWNCETGYIRDDDKLSCIPEDVCGIGYTFNVTTRDCDLI